MDYLLRPPELAQDDTPMIDVVQHALSCIPGSLGDIWVLLQPTQPFRRPKHIQQAVAILRDEAADSVVSVMELPKSHHPEFQCQIDQASYLFPYHGAEFGAVPKCRQDVEPAYIRDGTVYAFWRKTVERYGTIYGEFPLPLIIPPDETCELDTEADWRDVERRWKEQHG